MAEQVLPEAPPLIHAYLGLCLGGLEEQCAEEFKRYMGRPPSYTARVTPFQREPDTNLTKTSTSAGTAGVGVLEILTDAPLSKLRHIPCLQGLLAHLASVDGLNIHGKGGDKEECLKILSDVVCSADWHRAVETWKLWRPSDDLADIEERLSGGDQKKLLFRVSPIRDGTHCFNSPEVGAKIGEGVLREASATNVYGTNNWAVSLRDFHLEVLCVVLNKSVVAGLVLFPRTAASNVTLPVEPRPWQPALGRRATLRPSTAHMMLNHLADLRKGDVVLDSFAGLNTIPIQASAQWPGVFGLGAELDTSCGPIVSENSSASLPRRKDGTADPGCSACCGMLHCDAQRLPLRNGSVDAICVDLPFGKSCGKATINRRLFPAAVRDMARVLRPGRCVVLLTVEPKVVLPCLTDSPLWERDCPSPAACVQVNVGGIKAYLFKARRSSAPADTQLPPRSKVVDCRGCVLSCGALPITRPKQRPDA